LFPEADVLVIEIADTDTEYVNATDSCSGETVQNGCAAKAFAKVIVQAVAVVPSVTSPAASVEPLVTAGEPPPHELGAGAASV
jgi:hypothetical protein